jgi:hypothetical protein
MPTLFKVVLLGFGALFIAVGIFLGVFVARGTAAEAIRAEALAPLGARELEARPAGEQVIVQGAVSARNPALFREFVAYTAEEYRGEEDSDGDPEWEADGGETPRLLVEAAGLVQVANTDYRIEGERATWRDRDVLLWNGVTGEGTKRYFGLVAGQPVTVVGALVQGVEGNEVRADVLFAGTQAEYVAAQRASAQALPWLGVFFGLLGLIAGGIGLWGVLRA